MLREVFQTKILQFSFIRGVLEGGCPRFWAILGVKRGKIACFGKKKLLFSSLIMLMKMCVESKVKESISDKNFVIFFY